MDELTINFSIEDLYALRIACDYYIYTFSENMDCAIDQNDYEYSERKKKAWEERRAKIQNVIDEHIDRKNKEFAEDNKIFFEIKGGSQQ